MSMVQLSDSQLSAKVETLKGFNEAFDKQGGVRPHWEYLLDSFSQMGEESIEERSRSVQRFLRDEGVTYNDYSAGGNARAWQLDPLPLAIDSHEWQAIESGIRQRAELLDLILKDLYGPRTLLKSGVLPPEIIFSHPGFLRSCQNVFLLGDSQLILYAADLIRVEDGSLQLLADRTQAPSGMGYALENRRAISRVFPSLFRDSHVHRLSHYFQNVRQRLAQLNPNGGVPHVAILTPGSYNETYFEHASLANYLGYTLVQGQDLRVKDGYLWLKTLDGLSRVDVLLRRVDDFYCDPVELKSDSQLGVPGLLEVIRGGRVSVVNPLGSGILENHALHKYMPAIARQMLGRDLNLKSVETYWCGETDDLQHSLENLDKMMIKGLHRGPQGVCIDASKLSDAKLAEWRKKIQLNPRFFVTQPIMKASHSPVWGDKSLGFKPFILRTFAVSAESSYSLMPGGLTRIAGDKEQVIISNRLGSLSKDTWVLASEPEKAMSLVEEQAETAYIKTELLELSSRAVENFFWAGRYAERVEMALRLIRVLCERLEGNFSSTDQSRDILLRAVTHLTSTYPGFLGKVSPGQGIEQELLDLLRNETRLGSVPWSLNALVKATDQVKDLLSADTQRILNDLSDEMLDLDMRLENGLRTGTEEVLDPLVTSLLAFSGLTHTAMPRDVGWHFLEIGRGIESALQRIALLRATLVPVVPVEQELLVLETTLSSLESLAAFRRRYQRQLSLSGAIELLLFDRRTPCSLVFQLLQLETHLRELPDQSNTHLNPASKALLEATTALQLAEANDMVKVQEGSFIRSDLDQLLARLHKLLVQLSTYLSSHYFDHSTTLHPMQLAPDQRPQS